MTECPYRERCWLLLVGGWRTDNGECRDVETCPTLERMKREREKQEAQPCPD